MKRNMEIARSILIELSSFQEGVVVVSFDEGSDPERIYNFDLLVERGFVVKRYFPTGGVGYRLSWEGSDFLSMIDFPETWEKITKLAKMQGCGVSEKLIIHYHELETRLWLIGA